MKLFVSVFLSICLAELTSAIDPNALTADVNAFMDSHATTSYKDFSELLFRYCASKYPTYYFSVSSMIPNPGFSWFGYNQIWVASRSGKAVYLVYTKQKPAAWYQYKEVASQAVMKQVQVPHCAEVSMTAQVQTAWKTIALYSEQVQAVSVFVVSGGSNLYEYGATAPMTFNNYKCGSGYRTIILVFGSHETNGIAHSSDFQRRVEIHGPESVLPSIA